LARALVVQGEEPAAVLGRALRDLEAGLALRGSFLQGQVLAGEMHLFHAEVERRAGRSPAVPLREVRATLERIRQLDPEAGGEIAVALNAFTRGEPTGLYPELAG
jgi:hypothetical protein